MDPNLTTPILINATLTQPSQGIFWNPVITTLLGIIIGWILNVSSSSFQEKKKLEREKIQKQKQIYSQLQGIKKSICQVYTTQAEIQVNFYWLKARANKGLPENKEYENASDYDHRITEGLMGIPNKSQKLWETMGMIEVSFSPTEKLKLLIDSIHKLDNDYDSTCLNVIKKFEDASTGSLSETGTRKEAIDLFDQMIEDSCNEPLRELAEYLKCEIAFEESKLKKPIWKTFLNSLSGEKDSNCSEMVKKQHLEK